MVSDTRNCYCDVMESYDFKEKTLTEGVWGDTCVYYSRQALLNSLSGF